VGALLHVLARQLLHAGSRWLMLRPLVTPTFYKNKKICANRSAYKNAYQIVVHTKNFQKNKSCIGCIAWHVILYFSKILEEPRRI
jgi:hypothetical protein